MRDPIRLAGTVAAAAILTLGLAPSAGAVSNTAAGVDHASVATAPARATDRYWKCRWPSYRNAHPWRCHQHFGRPDQGDDHGHDGGGHGGGGGGRDHRGDHDDHGPGWTGAVTGHPH